MADIAKWAILVAGLIAIVAIIVSLPIFDVLNIDELTAAISGIATIAADGLKNARAIINCFFTPVGRTLLTIVIGFKMFDFLYKWGFRVVFYAYNWIFK